ncbi:PorP/SprF family type IX secretion system membrane protein [Lunatimonas salinarum]|uniref:PorP/SprF family type IX secretion system membrane protein n=1 Tax=Lunatimonas salinarum TaxID=1774590 RepID=UPI001AE09A23|nr:type IX secretion system membrane protein PorP/SprF [Lunatimonas salinarum]
MKETFRILCVVWVALGLVVGNLQAQQLPQFSQYMFNGLHINPAYAGYKGEHYIQSTYRSQWVDFPGAPKTFTATGDFSANEGRMGFGASFMTDQFGPAKTNAIMASYAYRIQTGEDSYLGLGASAGAIEYAIDGSLFNPGDLDDPDVPQGVLNAFTPNLNTGVFFHTPRFYAGVSAYNLVGRQKLADEGLALAYHNLHYYVTMGGLFPLSEKVQFKPSFLVRHSDTGPTNVDLNGMVLFVERIWVGASYRTNVKVNSGLPEDLSSRNALSFILELFALDNLRLGYAYDLQNNVLSGLRNNSHEFSVGYYIAPRKVNMKNPRWF